MDRDLGQMGENIFSYWCSQANLIANSSQIDKTGWDYLVEFPFESSYSAGKVHDTAFECKIQVKATDHCKGKWQVKLSNLRSLVTAQMPTFFVFIEFNGTETAQKAFIIHVDNTLISKVLKRIHTIEQGDKLQKLNKSSMIINYHNGYALENMNGESLKKVLLDYIGENYAQYISNKKLHLETTGYDEQACEIKFKLKGVENILSLNNAFLGSKEKIEVSSLKLIDTRFGIKSAALDEGKGFVQLSTEPREGSITFRESTLDIGITYDVKIYKSPLSSKELKDNLFKVKIEGDFFDLKISDNINVAFNFGEDLHLEVEKFKEALELAVQISTQDRKILVQVISENLPPLDFHIFGKHLGVDYSYELVTLDNIIALISDFKITKDINITYNQILSQSDQISNLYRFMAQDASKIEGDFSLKKEFESIKFKKETAIILRLEALIGEYIVSAIIVLIVNVNEKNPRDFTFTAKKRIVEQRMFYKEGKTFSSKDLDEKITEIADKYKKQEYEVLRLC